MLSVIRPGTAVTLCGGEIDATVTQVCIEIDNRVRYQVAWWDGRTRKTEWVDPFEVETAKGGPAPVRIGFLNGD